MGFGAFFRNTILIVVIGTKCIASDIIIPSLLLALPSDVAVPRAEKVQDQGDFPYCGFYAMTMFLELYGAARTGKNFLSLDPAYLAAAYNSEAETGAYGSSLTWLTIVVAKHGIIPEGAKLVANKTTTFPWPWPDWKALHFESLIPLEKTQPILTGEFTHKQVQGRFTGKSFLDHEVGIDLKEFMLVSTESKKKSGKTSQSDPKYRLGDFSATAKNLLQIGVAHGLKPSPKLVDHETLARSITEQVRSGWPVIFSLDTNTIKATKNDRPGVAPFYQQRLIAKDRLAVEEEEQLHAVVAVGLCDSGEVSENLCKPFKSMIQQQQISHCLLLQNSWGPEAHVQGYACVTEDALMEIAHRALLLKSVVE